MVPVEQAREIAAAARELIDRATVDEHHRLLGILLVAAWPTVRAFRN